VTAAHPGEQFPEPAQYALGGCRNGGGIFRPDVFREQCPLGGRMFTIGFNVTDRRRDVSYYDLLASEARLPVFVAIAAARSTPQAISLQIIES